ncbi:hypothetical protein D7Y15_12055 [Corallococcus sp. AB030]|uniref:hypothetical protein n=1 Tax=Corallococcus TaxID=83461 RepID=UPI000E9FFF88|nr:MULTISPECIES: hypothetical protein [Corallococcus]NNB92984.1 hypothetical protein [Corallococcus exiguus]RKH29436.1 hypothetical protein D7V77_05950 [Corallococcus sp. CA041A]RKI16368.1 hypothetical protein D7Y15_12055 [Corallococcus sp. AB030]RUO93574.1 hypothetical protein D7Y11_08860 [Corallococcus sp. AB018]
MNRITSLSGPRVQPTATNTASSVSGSRFGSLMSGAAAQPKMGAQLTGGSVVSTALAQMGATPHGGLMNAYTAGATSTPVNVTGNQTQQQQQAAASQTGAEPKSEEMQAIEDLAVMSAVSMSQSILHMGGMKLTLDRE